MEHSTGFDGSIYMHEPVNLQHYNTETLEGCTFFKSGKNIKFEAIYYLQDPFKNNIQHELNLSGQFEYVNAGEAKFDRIEMADQQYLVDSEQYDKLGEPWRVTYHPEHNGVMALDDKRTIFFQDPQIASIIMRVPPELGNAQDYVPVPKAE